MDPDQITTAPDASPDSGEVSFEDTDEIVLTAGEGETSDDGAAPPAATNEPAQQQVPSLADILGRFEQSATPAAEQYQPAPNALPATMPAWFDQRYTDPNAVRLEIERQQLHYAQRMATASADPNSVQAAYRDAYQNRVEAINTSQLLHQMTLAAYNLYQENQRLSGQMAPFRLLSAAEEFAKKYKVDDVGNLLVHPVTKEPITDVNMMAAIASVIGAQGVQTARTERQSVDRPVNMTPGRTSIDISRMDHRSKNFEKLEEMVRSGKKVTFR